MASKIRNIKYKTPITTQSAFIQCTFCQITTVPFQYTFCLTLSHNHGSSNTIRSICTDACDLWTLQTSYSSSNGRSRFGSPCRINKNKKQSGKISRSLDRDKHHWKINNYGVKRSNLLESYTLYLSICLFLEI